MDLLVENSSALRALADLATSLGIGLAIVGLAVNRRAERWRRMAETTATISRDYDALLRTSLEHTDLPLLDEPLMLEAFGVESTDPEIGTHRRRWIIWNLAINDLELAYLSLRSGPRRLRRAQWDGWRMWFLDNLAGEEFLRIWDRSKSAFHADFRNEIDAALAARVTTVDEASLVASVVEDVLDESMQADRPEASG